MLISEEDLKILVDASLWQCNECYQSSCENCNLKKVFNKLPKEYLEEIGDE